MKITISANSDVGCVRENNEDMLVVNDRFIRDGNYEDKLELSGQLLLAVSDGMGGHKAGELASEFVTREMQKAITGLSNNITGPTLNEAVKSIHARMNQMGLKDESIRGWGCTFTGVILSSGNCFVLHVGDSRLYQLRDRSFNCITYDHTLRNLLNDPSIPPNTIANVFGGDSTDIFLEFKKLDIMKGDVLLLCSDGLSGELTDEEIGHALLKKAKAADLVEMSKKKGGRDNVSVIIARL